MSRSGPRVDRRGQVIQSRERAAPDALDALAYVIGKKRTDWVLDADIRNFFDSIGLEAGRVSI